MKKTLNQVAFTLDIMSKKEKSSPASKRAKTRSDKELFRYYLKELGNDCVENDLLVEELAHESNLLEYTKSFKRPLVVRNAVPSWELGKAYFKIVPEQARKQDLRKVWGGVKSRTKKGGAVKLRPFMTPDGLRLASGDVALDKTPSPLHIFLTLLTELICDEVKGKQRSFIEETEIMEESLFRLVDAKFCNRHRNWSIFASMEGFGPAIEVKSLRLSAIHVDNLDFLSRMPWKISQFMPSKIIASFRHFSLYLVSGLLKFQPCTTILCSFHFYCKFED